MGEHETNIIETGLILGKQRELLKKEMCIRKHTRISEKVDEFFKRRKNRRHCTNTKDKT